MKTALYILTLALLALPGCRKTGLAADSGQAVREALEAQRESDGKLGRISANDAKNVVDAHYQGAPAKSGSGSRGPAPLMSGGLTIVSPGGAASTLSSQSSAGGSDGIRLRAK